MSLYSMKIFEQGKSLNDLLPSNLLSDLEIDTNEASSLTEESLIDVRELIYHIYRIHPYHQNLFNSLTINL